MPIDEWVAQTSQTVNFSDAEKKKIDSHQALVINWEVATGRTTSKLRHAWEAFSNVGFRTVMNISH
jgi:hypothetical protein